MSVPSAVPPLPHFSAEDARYRAPRPAGPVLTLQNKRAFRNPKKLLDKAGVAPATLCCEGVPEEVPPGILAVGRLPEMAPVRAVEWSWKSPLAGDEHLLVNFLAAPAFADLDSLWLDGAPTEDGGVHRRSGRFLATLLQTGRLPSQHLHLAGLTIDVPAIRSLRAWEGFGRLLSCRLTWALGGRRWSRLLGTIPSDNHLRFLELSWSDLGDAGLESLLGRPLPHLEQLVLQQVGLTDVGARRLLGWPGLDRLRWLDLGGNDLSDDVLAELEARLGDRLRAEPAH